MDLQKYKITIGSSNTLIYEDPVLGSNGTAVVTKVNGLIDALSSEPSNDETIAKGNLITGDSSGNRSFLTPGPNGYGLVVDTSAPYGLAYKELFDLNSNQTIGGVKTFSEDLIAGSNLTVVGDVTAFNLSGNNTGDESLASTILSGLVKITSNEADPIVYTKVDADTLFATKAELSSVTPAINGFVEIIGDGSNTDYTITHSLNSEVIVQTVEINTGLEVYTEVERVDFDSIIVRFSQPLAQDSIKVLILSLNI